MFAQLLTKYTVVIGQNSYYSVENFTIILCKLVLLALLYFSITTVLSSVVISYGNIYLDNILSGMLCLHTSTQVLYIYWIIVQCNSSMALNCSTLISHTSGQFIAI